MLERALRWLLFATLTTLAACGGGGDTTGQDVLKQWRDSSGPTVIQQVKVTLTSDAGDPLGQGQTYEYTLADARIAVGVEPGIVGVQIRGDEGWGGRFQIPGAPAEMAGGRFEYAGPTWPIPPVGQPFMAWSRAGLPSCTAVSGEFTLSNVTYVGSTLEAFELAFIQYCDGASAALRGTITWTRSDPTLPPGPVNPPPASLWSPAAGRTPAFGTYIYLESDPGDPVGAGQTALFTSMQFIDVKVHHDPLLETYLAVRIGTGEAGTGSFQPMYPLTDLPPGYYENLEMGPVWNPAKARFGWSMDGRSCEPRGGWFVIDSIVRLGDGSVESLKMRFEQRCAGAAGALRGVISWERSDQYWQPLPVSPPLNLWEPAAGATPAPGPYVYLRSDAGDPIGAGGSYLYTAANAAISVDASTADAFRISVAHRDGTWTGVFQGPQNKPLLGGGYYGAVGSYPNQTSSARGGLTWYGNTGACNHLDGWFVVDALTSPSGRLSFMRLRFAQHCESAAAALRGEIVWGVALDEPHGQPAPQPLPDEPSPRQQPQPLLAPDRPLSTKRLIRR